MAYLATLQAAVQCATAADRCLQYPGFSAGLPVFRSFQRIAAMNDGADAYQPRNCGPISTSHWEDGPNFLDVSDSM